MDQNKVDAVLQSHAPVMGVPLHGEFVSLAEPGHRFLVAADGLWLEARRAWIHILTPLALDGGVAKPYGQLQRTIRCELEGLPQELLNEFVKQCEEAYPNETGAVVVWNEATGLMELRRTEEVVAGVGFLRAAWPTLNKEEHIVFDLHSHGPLEPCFSEKDVADTGGEVVMCGVIGWLNTNPTLVLELFAAGKRIPLASIPLGRGTPA